MFPSDSLMWQHFFWSKNQYQLTIYVQLQLFYFITVLTYILWVLCPLGVSATELTYQQLVSELQL